MVSFDLIQQLHATANERKSTPSPYAGELFSEEVWEYISQQPGSVVDVRTRAELQFSGAPSISETKANFYAIPWLHYPDYNPNPDFFSDITANITDQSAPIFFLCKVGGRSFQAANAVAEVGFRYCFNITHGFEGDFNEKKQRGTINGWKAAGLPWTQA